MKDGAPFWATVAILGSVFLLCTAWVQVERIRHAPCTTAAVTPVRAHPPHQLSHNPFGREER